MPPRPPPPLLPEPHSPLCRGRLRRHVLPLLAPSGWSSSAHFCTWNNVKCDSTNSFVASINLDSVVVSGTLPPETNQLSQLQSLAVQQNSLTGALHSFQNMTSLEQLYLDNNDFTSIPNNFLAGLTNLQVFSISMEFGRSSVVYEVDTGPEEHTEKEAKVIQISGDFLTKQPDGSVQSGGTTYLSQAAKWLSFA
ncbi:receptor-like kinase TMK4 [Salvia miltiorrhiza]|uniref:receptor-like kinase TMK4 n=1 Tax=Salvia miltiorrhiza TaxID=226208 RepID=UPI0025AD3FFC|nr:receptor-like kinase TMK4 [Salvia miltiorrhiza]